MFKDLQTPLEWLDNFNKVILNSRSRKKSEDIPLQQGMEELAILFRKVHESHSSVWWVGNGGSSAICSHLAQDILNKLKIKSFFCGDTALLTCMANDFGYENVYKKPLAMFMEQGDLLIAISSSGNSANITGCAYTQSELYGIVELAHEAILHAVIETLYLNSFAAAKKR